MLLHDPASALRFGEYGILIPALDSRAAAVLAGLDGLGPAGQSGRLERVAGLQGAAARLGVAPAALAVGRADLERVHDAAFVARLFGAGLEAELVKTYELVDEAGRPNRYAPERAVRPLSDLFAAILRQVTGAYAACRLALAGGGSGRPGFAFYLGGGMHHARLDAGSGFCPVNDILVVAARLAAEGRAATVWVIDVDAHKGDGTAEIVRARRTAAAGDPDLLALSIHMAAGWPLDPATLEANRRAGRGAGLAPLAPSDVDLLVAEGEEAAYLPRLRQGLVELEARAAGRRPDLAIVVDGADPYEHDGLPSASGLRLSLAACVERDRTVLDFLDARGVPSAWLLAGGYGERAWEPPAAFLGSLARA
jgi:acetoin utilization deacetylase AcuC-like enzyme